MLSISAIAVRAEMNRATQGYTTSNSTPAGRNKFVYDALIQIPSGSILVEFYTWTDNAVVATQHPNKWLQS